MSGLKIGCEDVEVTGGKNFWLHSELMGYDIIHIISPGPPTIYPRICVQSTTEPVSFDPAETAFVIIDPQNYFLSPYPGRPANSLDLAVVDTLLEHAIPACVKADIPVVWLGWGVTDEHIDGMPPTIIK